METKYKVLGRGIRSKEVGEGEEGKYPLNSSWRLMHSAKLTMRIFGIRSTAINDRSTNPKRKE